MKIAIIFTNDYEVYGNGTGDVQEALVMPTEGMLHKFGSFGVRHTIFADIVEYWRFREAEDSGIFGPKYKAATLIEHQLRDSVRAGHDVQLHVHPQWLLAEPLDSTNWKVNEDHWRTSNIPNGLGATDDRLSLRGVLSEGKKTLESLLRPIKPDYECIAFRAGGYCIQPEGNVLQAMLDVGLYLDSSVCPGRYLDRFPAFFDFRSAPRDSAYWKISDNVNCPDSGGRLMEVPVATGRQSRLDSSWMKGKRVTSILRRLLLPQTVNLDYCKLGGPELVEMTERYISHMKRGLENPHVPIPVVLIGHSKEWKGQDSLDYYLEWLRSQSNIEAMTLFDWTARMRSLNVTNR